MSPDAQRAAPSPIDEIEKAAQRALRERPSFLIRTRISLGFFLMFLLSVGISVASLIIINRIQHKLQFMESATSYTFEIQQARRFEKNYFLYGTNLVDALDHVRQAELILEREHSNFTSVIGSAHFGTMRGHVRRYEQLLDRLAQRSRPGPPNAEASDPIQLELREHGAQMVAVAEELVAKERQAVRSMLLISQRIPIAFLAVLFVLIVYVANFIARQMLQPLNRLMDAARRIADGDFTPIQPARRYRDEFTELAITMNHMMHQLVHRQEQLVQSHKLQAVGTLTAGVAHELNNPINNTMLTACMLLEDHETMSSEERADMIQDLVHEAERARRIVRNLLDFARESEMKTELLKVEELLEKTMRLIANEIRFAKVKVQLQYASNLPPIHGDCQQLNQVLVNIILNALDAMKQGGVLTVTTAQAPNRDYLSIDISDTGSGIPEHILPNIFDPFFTTKPTGKGTGLGLSVSLGILRKHGGDIQVESRVGKGTTFTVLLPVAKVPASIPPPSEDRRVPAAAHHAPGADTDPEAPPRDRSAT